MGTINKEAYAKLIEEDIAEMEKYMPKYSLGKRHAIEVLRYSINVLYEADEVLVDLNKADVSGECLHPYNSVRTDKITELRRCSICEKEWY